MLDTLLDVGVVVSVLCALTTAAGVLYNAANGAARARRDAAKALETVAGVRGEWAEANLELGAILERIIEERGLAERARNRAAAISGQEKRAQEREEAAEEGRQPQTRAEWEQHARSRGLMN